MVVSNLEPPQSPQDQGGSSHPLSIADGDGTESRRILQDTNPLEGSAFQGVSPVKVTETEGYTVSSSLSKLNT